MNFTSLLDSDRPLADASEGSLFNPLAGCNCIYCAAGTTPEFQPEFALAPGMSAVLATAPTASTSGAGPALLSGNSWAGLPTGADGRLQITYSFSNAGSLYGDESAGYASTAREFSQADKVMTRKLLDSISAVANIRFVEVQDDGANAGEIRYSYSQAPNDMGFGGFAFFPNAPGSAGDVWIGAGQATSQWDWYRPNLVLHETLHAIGLKHPFDGASRLDSTSDIIPNTVMSYSAMAGSRSGSLDKYPAMPMPLDIVALQAMYGAAQTNTGDTSYDLASSAFQSGFNALWDAGGMDTLDASRVGRGVTLDLREGGASDIGVRVNANAYYGAVNAANMRTQVYTNTLTLAAGTRIEKAVGSNSDDVFITGTATRSVHGGNGVDVAVFAGRMEDYTISTGGGSYQVHSRDGRYSTELSAVERIEFSNVNLQVGVATSATDTSAYAQAFRLYNAALDRAPDQGGLIFQTQALKSGHSLTDLAGNFMASPEFQARFSVADNSSFVTLLYANVLDRAPDAGGLAYHIDRLAHGATRADILVGFSESPENMAATAATLIGMSAAGMLFPV